MNLKERIAKRRADTPLLYQKLYDRCMNGEASPRQAIKMQCLECWGWVRAETATCDNVACPLYQYRPYQEPSGLRENEVEAVESTNDENG